MLQFIFNEICEHFEAHPEHKYHDIKTASGVLSLNIVKKYVLFIGHYRIFYQLFLVKNGQKHIVEFCLYYI